jgi:hypothetical protein
MGVESVSPTFKKVAADVGRAAFGLVVGLGCLLTAVSLFDFFVLATTGAPSGPPTPPEAPSTTDALMTLIYGSAMTVTPFLIRLGIRRWQQPRER